jgi:hypothetical protein
VKQLMKPKLFVQWAGDRACVDEPIWRTADDEYTHRIYFETLFEAIRYARRSGSFMVFDDHKWHEVIS